MAEEFVLCKLFLKDFVTRKKILVYLLAVFVFAALLFTVRSRTGQLYIPDKGLFISGIVVIYFSSTYLIFTYSNVEQMELYVSLPIRKSTMFSGLSFALFATALFQRLLFLFVFIIIHVDKPVRCILFVSLYSVLAVMLVLLLLLALNKGARGIVLLDAVILLLLLGVVITDSRLVAVPGVLILGGLTTLLCMRFDVQDLIVRRKVYSSGNNKRTKNYFLQALMSEKIYVVNTVFVLGFILFIGFISKEKHVMWDIVWAVGAMNTPLLTSFSGDREMVRQIEMLPNANKTLYHQYMCFLGSYFFLVNCLTFMWKSVLLSRFLIREVVFFAVITYVEVFVATLLEKRFRIDNWQTKQELWRKPRKYVLPLLIFFISAAYSFVCGI